jgi:hypothetical protein
MSIRNRVILVALAMLVGTAAVAREVKPDMPGAGDYPPEVRQSLRYAQDECKRQGGSKATLAPDTVRKIDLTGDGREDYIVDFRDTQCEGAAAVYCGTGGCSMDILVTLPNGKIRTVFSDRVRAYDVLPGEGARKIRFELHGSFCGRSGNPSCEKEHMISARPFAFKEPKESK